MTIEQRLRDLASKATKGPWCHSGHGAKFVLARMRGINEAIHGEQHEVILGTVKGPDDAAYISSLDPDTVLRLLDVVATLRDIAENGTRHDLSPTIQTCSHGGWDGGLAYGYIRSMDETVRNTARRALSRLDEGEK